MRYIFLDSIHRVKKICYVCEVYKDFFDVDISYGSYVVDGCSILGVTQLIGKEVKIEAHCPREDLAECFYKEAEGIGAYKKESEVT